MKTASITEAKNNLSKLIDGLAAAGPVVITDRGRPVARLEAARLNESGEENARVASLVRRGILIPAQEPLTEEFLNRPLVKLPKGVSALQALLDEREEGR